MAYSAGPSPRTLEYRGKYVPGYEPMLRMAAQVIAEFAPVSACVLVLGAGGGLEIEAFSNIAPDWRFLAIDPDRGMLDAARERARASGSFERVDWVEGVVFDAPDGKTCDAATSLLTLHFVPDDGTKLATLRGVRERLRKGAPFLLVDNCIDKTDPEHALWVERHFKFGIDAGIERSEMESGKERIYTVLHTISEQRTESLLREAGFQDVTLFYAAFAWRGWIAYA